MTIKATEQGTYEITGVDDTRKAPGTLIISAPVVGSRKVEMSAQAGGDHTKWIIDADELIKMAHDVHTAMQVITERTHYSRTYVVTCPDTGAEGYLELVAGEEPDDQDAFYMIAIGERVFGINFDLEALKDLHRATFRTWDACLGADDDEI